MLLRLSVAGFQGLGQELAHDFGAARGGVFCDFVNGGNQLFWQSH